MYMDILVLCWVCDINVLRMKHKIRNIITGISMMIYMLGMWPYIKYMDILILYTNTKVRIIIVYLKNRAAFEIFRVYTFEVS